MLRLSEIVKALPPQEGEEEYVHPGIQHVVYLKKPRLPDLMSIVAEYGGAAVTPVEELSPFEFVLTIRIPYGRTKDFLSNLYEEGIRYLT
jgi:hypothetical protein